MANGKGSGRRPAAVDDAKVASEWERIFGPATYKIDPDLDAVISGFRISAENAQREAARRGEPVYHEWPIAPEPHEQ